MTIKFQKRKFLEKNIEYLVFMSSFTQGRDYPVYRKDREISDEERNMFKNYITQKLSKLAQSYKNKQNITENKHVSNIENLQKDLSLKWSSVLYPHKNNPYKNKQAGWITFGRIQKLLNLYLKYHWSLNWIDEPLHCPIDSVILREIKETGWNIPPWTHPDFKKEEYNESIKKCKTKAKKLRIATWELEVFNKLSR